MDSKTVHSRRRCCCSTPQPHWELTRTQTSLEESTCNLLCVASCLCWATSAMWTSVTFGQVCVMLWCLPASLAPKVY